MVAQFRSFHVYFSEMPFSLFSFLFWKTCIIGTSLGRFLSSAVENYQTKSFARQFCKRLEIIVNDTVLRHSQFSNYSSASCVGFEEGCGALTYDLTVVTELPARAVTRN